MLSITLGGSFKQSDLLQKKNLYTPNSQPNHAWNFNLFANAEIYCWREIDCTVGKDGDDSHLNNGQMGFISHEICVKLIESTNICRRV